MGSPPDVIFRPDLGMIWVTNIVSAWEQLWTVWYCRADAYLVHCERAASKDLAGVTMAEDVLALVLAERNVPLEILTMARSLVGSHDGSGYSKFW